MISRTTHPCLSPARLGAVVLALLVPAALAVAQPTPQEVAFGGAGTPGSQTYFCGTNKVFLGPGTKTAACVMSGASHNALGEAIGGVVRAYASTTIATTLASSGLTWSTTGMGYWGDRLTFASGSVLPAFVTLSLHFTGNVSADISAGPRAPNDGSYMTGVAQASWSFNAASTKMLANYNQASRLTVGSDAGIGYPGSASAVVDDAQTFVLPVDPMLPLIDLWYSVNTGASFIGQFGSPASTRPYIGSLIADMSHTGVITGLSFQDAKGAAITNGVNYSFVNGARIVPTAAPEPSALALLGGGLALVGAALRRRTA